jgi:phosphomannomutase
MTKRLIAEMMTRCGVAFDSSGARGPVVRMTDEVCYAYTAAFAATVAADCTEIVLGCDARASSPRIASACAAALHDAGHRVIHGGVIPASAVALAAWTTGRAGIMVTGGDAPADRNGLRFFGPDGEPTRQDARRVAACEVDMPAGVLAATLGPVDPTVSRIAVERLLDAFGPSSLAGLTVGVCGDQGTDTDLLAEAIGALGATITRIERTPSAGPRWGRPDRGELERLARDACERFALDAVVALDGDGTRPMLADELGAWRTGDAISLIAARGIEARALVVPVSASGVYDQVGAFDSVTRCGRGTRSMLETMASRTPSAGLAPIGCDTDGAWVLRAAHPQDDRLFGALPTRDALLPIAAALRAARAARGPVSALFEALPRRFTARNALTGLIGERGADLLRRLAIDPTSIASLLAPSSGPTVAIDTVDGLRARFANGDVVHLRTIDEPAGLQCATESGHRDEAERLCGECLARIVQREAEATVSVMVGGIPVGTA